MRIVAGAFADLASRDVTIGPEIEMVLCLAGRLGSSSHYIRGAGARLSHQSDAGIHAAFTAGPTTPEGPAARILGGYDAIAAEIEGGAVHAV